MNRDRALGGFSVKVNPDYSAKNLADPEKGNLIKPGQVVISPYNNHIYFEDYKTGMFLSGMKIKIDGKLTRILQSHVYELSEEKVKWRFYGTTCEAPKYGRNKEEPYTSMVINSKNELCYYGRSYKKNECITIYDLNTNEEKFTKCFELPYEYHIAVNPVSDELYLCSFVKIPMINWFNPDTKSIDTFIYPSKLTKYEIDYEALCFDPDGNLYLVGKASFDDYKITIIHPDKEIEQKGIALSKALGADVTKSVDFMKFNPVSKNLILSGDFFWKAKKGESGCSESAILEVDPVSGRIFSPIVRLQYRDEPTVMSIAGLDVDKKGNIYFTAIDNMSGYGCLIQIRKK